MRITFIVSALGMAHLAIARAAAGPYTAAYDKYCGGGKTEGIITAGSKTYSYKCDVGQSVAGTPFRTRSLDLCAEECEDEGSSCSAAVWDRANGNCWLGTSGTRIAHVGQILIYDDPAAQCNAELAKFTGPAKCSSKNERRVTKVNGQDFVLACGTRLGVTRGNNAGKVASLEACVETCTNRAGCKAVMWNRKDTICYVTSGNALEKEVTANDDIDAAFKLQ